MRRPLASLVLTLLLAACGQTGPLYLPEPAAVEPAAVEPAAVEPAQSTGSEQ